MTDKLDKAKWIAYQELNDDDIMDAIQGSVAIPLAIKYNARSVRRTSSQIGLLLM